ncbi:MAG TPA: hypothetical protein VFV19_09025 [Candidatus Polarisedimenticolaceae bacterium]|nr:hypothetical protein [Candidatus Polarisedimenticolaceae bacterium]
MHRRFLPWALLIVGIAALPHAEAAEKMKGVCWEAAGPIDGTALAPLHDLGAGWISQTPFGWAVGLDVPEVRFSGERGLWGETDSGLVATATAARALGIKTLLKPHLWVRHGAWQGDIAMATDDEWAKWFASYEAFILHYARLAEANGFEALAVGTELAKASGRTDDWKRVIAHVRAVYHGKLTYAANWNEEAERIAFWNDLDFIGVQAYYPLATVDRPDEKAIEAAWKPIAARLEALGRRTGKPVVFTEIGFKSHAGALKQPWVWVTDGDVDLGLQHDAFAAMFGTFWGKPWFGGTFVWKWHPSGPEGPRAERDFTPQGKPALAVIKSYYRAP